MKTIEQKAKAYDEALERANELLLGNEHSNTIRSYFEHIFPELRESEDEIHRKWILEYLYDGLRKADEQFKDHFKSAIDWLEKQKEHVPENEESGTRKEQKPISSYDIVPYIDDKIAALQDMWREEKVAFDWDDMKDMIEDVARHFYQKEQKPSYGIYWHAIKKGERLPCCAYIWDHNFEKYYDFWEGRLIPNMENILIGRDTWYLPADDVRDLPREGVDELLKGHNSDWSEEDEKMLTSIIFTLAAYIGNEDKVDWLKSLRPQQKAEWSEEDKEKLYQVIENLLADKEVALREYPLCKSLHEAYDDMITFLKSLRPSWKPSEEQMDALKDAIIYVESSESNFKGSGFLLESLFNNLQKLIQP